MKITQLQDTKLINNMTPPRANPSVIMLDHGDSLDDYLFERGDLLDALSTKIYYDDVKTELATIYDVVTTKLRNHISDTCCHITAEERRRWNSCLSKEYVTGLIDAINQRLDGHEVILDQLQQEIADLPDFTQFVLRSELPDWSQFVTKAYLDEVLRNNVTTDNFMDELLAALGDIDPGDIDLHGYVKEGGYLGKINGIDFYQGHSIEIPTGGGGGDTGLPYKVTGLTYANNRLVLTQENNPNSPFEVEIAGGGGGGGYVLPVATSTTLGGIKVGFAENNKNYAVKLDGNYNAYVTVPWHSSEGGQGGEDGGYWEIIFTATLTEDEPTLPAYSEGIPAGWSHSAENSDGTKIVWMANRWVNGDGTKSNWNGPWRISGPNGENGIDGNEYEYIYTRTTSDDSTTVPAITNTPSSSSTGRTPQEDDFVPVNWTDNPQGVDQTIRYEWVAIRRKEYSTTYPDGVWGSFSSPVIWSSYGRNGTDGDGVEYIFYLDNSGTHAPSSSTPLNWPPYWDSDPDYQTTPEYIRSGSSWTDDPQPMSVQGGMQWVSIRKRQNEVWQAYSTPTLWSYYAKDGEDGQDGTIQFLEYPVLRFMGVWDRDSEMANPHTYNDGTVSEGNICYQDVVEWTDSQNNTQFYKCVQAHSVAHSPADTDFWKPFMVGGDVAFDAMLAKSAYIQSLSVEQLVVFDNNNQICAGMSGNSATVGSSDIRIWAGAIASSGSVVPGNLANAPFTVDMNGKLKASNAEIAGTVTASRFNSVPVEVSGTAGETISVQDDGIYKNSTKIANFSSNIQVNYTGSYSATGNLTVDLDLSGADSNGIEITVCDMSDSYNSSTQDPVGKIRVTTTGLLKFSVPELATVSGTQTVRVVPYMSGNATKLIHGGCATFRYFYKASDVSHPSRWYATGDVAKDA